MHEEINVYNTIISLLILLESLIQGLGTPIKIEDRRY